MLINGERRCSYEKKLVSDLLVYGPKDRLAVLAPCRLRDQSVTGNREVMIERERKPNARALHDDKAGRIHCRQLVQVGASEIFPGLLQIAQLAGKDIDGSGRRDRALPRQGSS